jgi:hypothetical protein
MATERDRLFDTWIQEAQRFADVARLVPAAKLDASDDSNWSPRQIAGHLLDSEITFSSRLRTAISQPGAGVAPFAQDALARSIPYATVDLDFILRAFVALRVANVEILRALPPDGWCLTIEHPALGTQTLEEVVNVFTRHVPDHLADIESVIASSVH